MQWQSCRPADRPGLIHHQFAHDKDCAHELLSGNQVLQECQQSCVPRVHLLLDDLAMPCAAAPHMLQGLYLHYSISCTRTGMHHQSAVSIVQLVAVIAEKHYLCQPQ